MKKTFLISMAFVTALACCPEPKQCVEVVPYPNSVEMKDGTFDVTGAEVHLDATMDEQSKEVVGNFARQLALASGQACEVTEGTASTGISFIMDTSLPHEAYTLKVGKKGVTVMASGLNGFNYAIQTLKQMLPAAIYGKTAAASEDWNLPCCEIEDAPRFVYRGMHLDVSRHFFDIDMVKRYLDIMEIHKLNTLHWHLTDDQGWRIEIKKYPRLTEVGSVRNKTIIGHIFNSQGYDHTRYGEGMWYTQEQIREVIDYAAAKGIEIIPEIDLPGHMLAALAAYPELGCTGGPYEVWGDWGIADEVLCAGNEKTMLFLEDVLDEVSDLFPSEYIHIGGDECPKVYWEKCPKCQAKIKGLGLKDTEEFQAEHFLQSYVMTRMTNALEKKGKKIIGWDEILEGDVAENAIVMSWRGTAGGIKAAQMGHDVIMTPNTFFYLDYYQSEDTADEPLGIGGYLPVEKCYSYEPFAEEMTEEEQSHILGVQANLWTEYIASNEHLEYMLLPRLAALSEVQWCQSENKCWDRFLESADNFCRIYDAAGYNYAKHIFNARGSVKVEDGAVHVTLEAQGDTPIRYTLDGSEPTETSALYEAPVEIKESCVLKAKSFINGADTKTFAKEFNAHKAMAAKMTMNTPAHVHYSAGLPYILADGIRGTQNFRSGDWGGWRNEPFDVTIEMNGDEPYSKVTLGAVVIKYDDIFNPATLTVLTSEDGQNFNEVGKAEYSIEGEAEVNGLKEYSVTFPETSAKYLRVVSEPVASLPAWHERKGSKGFLFIDEIVVE